MSTPLPSSAQFTGSDATQADQKSFMNSFRAFIAGLLGTDGDPATARAALQVRNDAMFLPHAAGTPNMTVLVDAGSLIASGTRISQPQQVTGAFTAPGSNSRIDRVVIDAVTGTISVVAGTVAASPVAPAIPAGKLPCCQVGPILPGTTAITDSMITDERTPWGGVRPDNVISQDFTSATTTGTAPDLAFDSKLGDGVAYAAWQRHTIKFHVAGATSLNRDEKGEVALKKLDSSGAKVDFVSTANAIHDVQHDGTHFVVLNPLPPVFVASVSVPVRQTVLGGPVDSSGYPSFLPAASGSLSISSQNVTSSTLFVVAAANGFGSAGAVDSIGQSTANITWSGLTANSTNYLYVDVSANGTLTPGSTTLAPTYQFGGTRSTTNNQATFNIQEMSMTVGNGSSAVQTYRVFVGEAVTNASTVTSTVAYAYHARYDSGYTNTLPGTSTQVSRSHNLGVLPSFYDIDIKCLTAENGYSVGDIVRSLNTYDTTQLTLKIRASHKTISFTTANVVAIYLQNASTGANVAPSAANWAYRLFAQRGW